MPQTHQQYAGLAFRVMQRRQWLKEPGLGDEVARLRKDVRALVEVG